MTTTTVMSLLAARMKDDDSVLAHSNNGLSTIYSFVDVRWEETRETRVHQRRNPRHRHHRCSNNCRRNDRHDDPMV